MNNIVNCDCSISIRQSEKGNTYLRIWHQELGAIVISDRNSFDKIVKACGGWSAGNLINVPKQGRDGEWLDLQFKGVFSLELKLRAGENCCFATVITAEKQRAFSITIPKGVATQENDSAKEPAPAPAPVPTAKRKPAF